MKSFEKKTKNSHKLDLPTQGNKLKHNSNKKCLILQKITKSNKVYKINKFSECATFQNLCFVCYKMRSLVPQCDVS